MVMTLSLRFVLLVTVLFASGACQRPPALHASVPRLVLAGTDGTKHDLAEESRSSRLTVLFFTAWNCPCQAVHDARIRDLYAHYHSLGVDVLAIDSEVGGKVERDKEEATRRGYAFPVLVDTGGALARAVGAEYATESFVLDSTGIVRYHGGLDSDRKQLHDDAQPFLRDALDDLLAGKSLRMAESKALGCALQTW
jgi:peroxiredoxin